MTHRKGAIWTERVLLTLILGSLIGSLNLIVALNRRAAAQRSSRDAQTKIAEPSPPVSSQPIAQSSPLTVSSPKDIKPVHSAIGQEPAKPKVLEARAPVDPTTKIVAALSASTAREIEASQKADRRAEALEEARRAAVAESHKWKRRELLVLQQIASLNDLAEKLETSASILDAERDVLARERDALKAALTKASQRSGFAVLPYKGPNGTWRRPIVLECSAGLVKLQPEGLKFTMMELSPYLHPRSSPFVRAISRELLHIQSADTPDGAPAVPYLVFLVRPDGIRPYYEARSRLEPLGIAFGYELIEQDLAVDIPDFDNLTTWDGSVPLEMPLEKAPQPKSTVAMLSTAEQGTSWPSNGRGGDSANSESSTPADFVWPSRGRQTDARNLPGSASAGMESPGDPTTASGSGHSATKLGGDEPTGFGGRDSTGPSLPGPQTSSGAGSGSGSGFPGGGAARSPAQQSSGSGSGVSGAGGLGSLPDLEPAGDALSSQPIPLRGGSSPGLSGSSGMGSGSQSLNLGGGQAGAGLASIGGSGSTDANASGGGQELGFAPYRGAAGGTPTAGSGSVLSGGGATGQYSAPGQGSSGGGLMTRTSGGTVPGASAVPSLPPLPQTGYVGTAAPNQQSGTGPNTGGDAFTNPGATNMPPQGSNVSGSASGSSAGTSSEFGPGSNSGASSNSSSATTTGSSSGGSSSPTSSTSASGGMPLGSMSSTGPPSASGSTFSFGQDSGSDSSKQAVTPPPPKPTLTMGSIEVPFEIVVVCRQRDLLLHPGGYRLTTQAMKEQGGGKDGLLAREIRALVRHRRRLTR